MSHGPPGSVRIFKVLALIPVALTLISPSPSARARPGGAYSKHTCARERLARFVSAYERSGAGPFSNRATPKVVRPLRASKVVRLGAGLASFPLRLWPSGWSHAICRRQAKRFTKMGERAHSKFLQA